MNQASLLRFELEQRGVKLNRPATRQKIDKLERVVGGELSPAISGVFAAFDGFNDDFDEGTFITVWGIDRIIDNVDYRKLPYVPFADRAFNAEIFRMCATDENKPVLDEAGVAFRDYIDFWERLLECR